MQVDDMRETVVNHIEILDKMEPFSTSGMRWGSFYLMRGAGLTWLTSRKERKRAVNCVHISEATREDWLALTNDQLMMAYTSLCRQASKQM